MDEFVAGFPSVADDDLRICESRGVAYQADMSVRVSYDRAYFDKYRRYEGSPIAQKLNAARVAMVRRHTSAPVLDVGIGSGEFLRACGPDSKGFDVNPAAVEMLQCAGRFHDDFSSVAAVTFWDALEHVENPAEYLNAIAPGAFLFAAVPIFTDLRAIRKSKHYRPGEHFYYWTAKGFVDWMAMYGFRLVEQNRDETAAGREAIESFAFVKDLAMRRAA